MSYDYLSLSILLNFFIHQTYAYTIVFSFVLAKWNVVQLNLSIGLVRFGSDFRQIIVGSDQSLLIMGSIGLVSKLIKFMV